MRRLVLAAAMFGMAFGARAADMPDFLRGSIPAAPVTRNWDGWYVGGQIGYSSADMDFGHAVKSLTNFIERNSVLQAPLEDWGPLSKNHTPSTGFGAVVGRTGKWDDLFLVFEANYISLSTLQIPSPNSRGRLIVTPAGENPPAG